jgi:hypothetical protein
MQASLYGQDSELQEALMSSACGQKEGNKGYIIFVEKPAGKWPPVRF